MKNYLKHIVTVLAVIALSYTLNAVPPGSDSQHIRYTAIEEILVPPVPDTEEGWLVYTVEKTFSIPSLQVDDLVLYVTYSYLETPGPGGSFSMHGVGSIFNEDWEKIGDSSFVNAGIYLSPPPDLSFVADGTVVGTIWAGPFAGFVMVENASLDVVLDLSGGLPGVAIQYDSFHEGFMLPSAVADIKALKK